MVDNVANCPNCGYVLTGKFCSSCGQKRIGPEDRTLIRFFREFIGSAFLLENNFLKNLWVLLQKPGQLPLDFREGRRKRWMPPLSVFLLINFFYFIFSPFSDLALSLSSQLEQFQHSWKARPMVDERLNERNVDFETYAKSYKETTTTLSNSLVILHAPMMAVFLALIFWRKQYYFLDHVMYAMYFVASILLLSLLYKFVIVSLSTVTPVTQNFREVSRYGLLAWVVLNLGFSLRRFYDLSNLRTILLAPLVFVVLIISHFLYRTIQFFLTFAFT